MHVSVPILVLCATTAVARAEPDPYARIEVARDSKLLRATLVNVPDAAPADITLTADTGERVTASTVTPYARTTTPIAIALVYNGDEIFAGNEDHEPDATMQYHGTLNALKAALDQPAFTTAFPAGSQLVAVTYDTAAIVRRPLGPLAQFRGAALGVEHDYRSRLGRELTQGIDLALAELERATTPRRALIVISDGTDTNPETARPRLALLRKRALQLGIELHAVIYKTPLSPEASVITTMIPGAVTIRSTRAFDEAVPNIVAGISRRYEVTFPIAKLPRDGKPHELTITIGSVALDPVSLVIPRAPSTGWSWCSQLAVGAAAALVLALAVFLRSRRRESTPRQVTG